MVTEPTWFRVHNNEQLQFIKDFLSRHWRVDSLAPGQTLTRVRHTALTLLALTAIFTKTTCLVCGTKDLTSATQVQYVAAAAAACMSL